MTTTRFKRLWKSLGPGLLFASAAIGTSHLVLSTRAGAHHGMIFFWVIALTLLFKYPFYEFGPRYASATGNSLLSAYKKQGTWAILLFMGVILVNMFAVTAAVSAVSAGLLSSILGIEGINMSIWVGGVLLLTSALLLIGRYSALDQFIKYLSLVLFIAVLVAFFAALLKGPVEPIDTLPPNDIFKGAGLALMISLMGWMPAGMEGSTFNSIWTVEKSKSMNHTLTVKEALFDFNLGYLFSALLAILFLVIGAFTVYGSGQLLEGNATQFSNKLLKIFTDNLGSWSYPFIAISAFAAIYGTLITVMDAFSRGWIRSMQIFKFSEVSSNDPEQVAYLKKYYSYMLPIISLGSFLLFTQFSKGMIAMLEAATILSFILAPIIAFLNLKAIQSPEVPEAYRAPRWMIVLSYLGIIFMLLFTGVYAFDAYFQ